MRRSDAPAEWYPFTAQVDGEDAFPVLGPQTMGSSMDASLEEIEASVEEIRDLGDTVLALGRSGARSRAGSRSTPAHPLPRRPPSGVGHTEGPPGPRCRRARD